jgi:hypothetical protein
MLSQFMSIRDKEPGSIANVSGSEWLSIAGVIALGLIAVAAAKMYRPGPGRPGGEVVGAEVVASDPPAPAADGPS